ncbi:MAG: type II secretion system F family protein [Candidatus Micrarchaeia archaeon]
MPPSKKEPFIDYLASFFPDLHKKLRMAKIKKAENDYIRDALIYSVLVFMILLIMLVLLFITAGINLAWLLLIAPITLLASFLFFMKRVDVIIASRERKIDKELLFAGRQLVIEIKAGIPLYDAITHLTADYGEASKVFREVIDKTNLGVPLDVAMEDVADETPSKPFKRIVLQMVNSIRSGSDIGIALETILDQLSQEQLIEIKVYSQKLNPLGMFYMLFGIIVPSLGVTLAVTLLTFTGVALSPMFLWGILVVIIIVQYIFLTMIETSRPKFEV